jgi:hypothetical protein
MVESGVVRIQVKWQSIEKNLSLRFEKKLLMPMEDRCVFVVERLDFLS